MEDLFSTYGKIKSISLKEKAEKFAFIEYEEQSAAQAAIDKYFLLKN